MKSVDGIAALLDALRAKGCSAKRAAGALATLHSVVRFALRHGWIATDPVDRLDPDERPRPARRRQRVLGRGEIERLLAACAPRDRLMVATARYTGMRISEVLGLIWDDVDFPAGVIHVRAQLSRAHRGQPARRVAPYGHRNVARRCLSRTANLAGLNDEGWPPLRFCDLRHVFASHLIVEIGLDVAQVSRILGHASPTITLNVYTHLFDDARHARAIREWMTTSAFAALLERGCASRSEPATLA